jgi:hypothetical protein
MDGHGLDRCGATDGRMDGRGASASASERTNTIASVTDMTIGFLLFYDTTDVLGGDQGWSVTSTPRTIASLTQKRFFVSL